MDPELIGTTVERHVKGQCALGRQDAFSGGRDIKLPIADVLELSGGVQVNQVST